MAKKKPLLLNSQGVALLKVLFGLVILLGLVLMDLQQKQKNAVSIKRKLAIGSVKELKKSLQNWLGTPGTIKHSFGHGSTGFSPLKQVVVYQAPTIDPSSEKKKANITGPNSREIVSNPTTDLYAITGLRLVDNPLSPGNLTVLLRQADLGTAGNPILLIGPPEGSTGIRSLDKAGWAYIKAMWVENFSRYDPTNLLDNGRDEGNADLRVLVWIFTNRDKDPGLNCIGQNNCIREVITLPLDIEIDSNGKITEGSYGLKCDGIIELEDDAVNDNTNFTCGLGRVFNIIRREVGDPDGDGTKQITKIIGRCCAIVE